MDRSQPDPIFFGEIKHDQIWYLCDLLNVEPKLKLFLNAYLSKDKKLREKDLRSLFTNEANYLLLRSVRKLPREIYISRQYMVLVFSWKSPKRYYWSDEPEKYTFTYYLIGVNSDDLLFVNKINNPYLRSTFLVKFIYDDLRYIDFYLFNGDDLFGVLGYSFDAETSYLKGYNTIFKGDIEGNSFRIQGDLILRVRDQGDLAYQAYINAVCSQVYDQVELALTQIILRRISSVLSQFNISSELNRDRLMVTCLKYGISYDEVHSLQSKMLKIILNHLYIGDILMNCENIDLYKLITVRVERGIWGERYYPLSISVNLPHGIVHKFMHYVMENFVPEITDLKIVLGRHILLFKGFPYRFNIASKLPLNSNFDEVDELLFSINLNVYYISKGELTVQHIEHGTYKYNILDDIFATFDNTEVSRDQAFRLNYLALKHLVI